MTGGVDGAVRPRLWGSSGPVVALLHGGPGAPGEMASLARALAHRYRVVEPFERRSAGVPLTVARHVADLAEVLPAGAALVGWSWGAMLALSFTAAHPGRVGSLALVGCGTYDPEARAVYEQALAERLGEEGRRRADALREEMTAAASDGERDRLLAALGHLLGRAQAFDPLPDEGGEAIRADARGHRETWADALRLQAEGAEPTAFSSISCPVLMLHGEDDPHPGRATYRLLRRTVPQMRYLSFPRCGHRPWAERQAREGFLAALQEWLG